MTGDDLRRSVGSNGPDTSIPDTLVDWRALEGPHQVHQDGHNREARVKLEVLLRRLKLVQAEQARLMESKIVGFAHHLAGVIGEVEFWRDQLV